MNRLTQIFPLILAAALQLLPLLRNIVTSPAASSSFAIILRWGIGAGAALGTVDAVSGATSVFTSSSTFSGAVGTPFSNNVVVSIGGGNTAASSDYFIVTAGTTSSPALANGQTTTVGMAPGLTFKSSWVNNASTIGGVIYGTPTTAGSYPATVTCVSPGNAQLSQAITITISGTTTPTAPTITGQPVPANVAAGKNAAFTVTASGTAPLGYFWSKNGSLLADGGNVSGSATATLTLASVAATDAGNYSVLVSNTVGTATSTAAALTVILPPAITSQPAPQTQAIGGTATFSVTASGTAPLNYFWLKNGAAIANGTKYSGVNFTTLTIATLATTDAGNYSVTVSNLAGTITSSAAALTVVSSPAIITPPANVSAVAGGNASFTVTAAGSAPLFYQWLKNSTPLTDGGNISGSATATLNLSAVTAADVASYSVTVSNSLGSVTSPAATLTVAIPPAIVTSPASATVLAGGSVSLTVTASGTAPLNYQWLKNSVAIPGATSATLTLANVSATDAANYSVTVTNAAGNVTSGTAVLTVQSPPVITTQPMGQFGALGSTITLSVTASGTGPLNYQWFSGGGALFDGGNISGSTSNLLTITALTTNGIGAYFVVVSNAFGSVTSASASIAVNASPIITSQPASQFAAVHSNVVFMVTATGTGPFRYQWLKNGVKLANGKTISGATSNSLTLANVAVTTSGKYSVMVTNIYGRATSTTATLSVLRPPSITSSVRIKPVPHVATSPAGILARAGTNVIFTITATGGAPLSYQWFKNGATLVDSGTVSGTTTNVLKITSLTTNDSGVYSVTVSNPVGSVTRGTTLIVVDPPVITTPPASQSVIVSHAVSFSVSNTGTAPFGYRWFKGTKIIPGATNSTFSLASVRTNNAGNYFVVVTNFSGSVTSATATLTVWLPPVFTLQATNRTARTGSTTVFSAAVSGTAPFNYQWFKNGAPLTDGGNLSGSLTSVLTIANVTTNDSGAYALTVNNIAGSSTSSNAVLTVRNRSSGGDGGGGGTDNLRIQPPGAVAALPPVIAQIVRHTDGSITLNGSGTAGTNYVLQASADLVNWTSISTNAADAGGQMQAHDPAAATLPTRFYRLVKP